jgi:hypothetical protein
VLQTPRVSGTAPDVKVVAVKELAGVLDSLRIIVANQNFGADELAVGAYRKNLVLRHSLARWIRRERSELTVTECCRGLGGDSSFYSKGERFVYPVPDLNPNWATPGQYRSAKLRHPFKALQE